MTDWQPAQQTPNGPAPRGHFGLRLGAMTLADIVDNSFKLFKENWRQIAVVVLILSIPTMIVAVIAQANGSITLTESIQSIADASAAGSEATTEMEAFTAADTAYTVIAFLLALLVQPFVTGVITRMVAASYLGRKLEAKEAAAGLLKKWPALIGATVLYGLTLIGAFAIMAIPIGVLSVITPWFAVLFILTPIPLIAIAVLLSSSIPVIAVEETGPARSLSRSWALVRRRFWPYLGTVIVIVIVAIVASTIVSSLLAVIQVLAENIFTPLAYPVIVAGEFASNLIMLPIIAIAFTLIYFDARIRFEGFDLQMMTSRLSSAQQPPTPPAPSAGPYDSQPGEPKQF